MSLSSPYLLTGSQNYLPDWCKIYLRSAGTPLLACIKSLWKPSDCHCHWKTDWPAQLCPPRHSSGPDRHADNAQTMQIAADSQVLAGSQSFSTFQMRLFARELEIEYLILEPSTSPKERNSLGENYYCFVRLQISPGVIGSISLHWIWKGQIRMLRYPSIFTILVLSSCLKSYSKFLTGHYF